MNIETYTFKTRRASYPIIFQFVCMAVLSNCENSDSKRELSSTDKLTREKNVRTTENKLSPTKFSGGSTKISAEVVISTDDPNEICSTKTYLDRNGDEKRGLKDCGQSGLSTCQTDGEVGCITTSSVVALEKSKILPGNIRNGMSIGGVTGQYPSVTYPLSGASGTPDLNATDFNSQVTSAAAFEYWDSAGSRHSSSGDADLVTGNIKTGITIFGVAGSDGPVVDAWDLRVGTSVSGVTGKLRVNCRNRAKTSIYNYDGVVSSLPNTAVSTGTDIDVWDTIDDYANDTGLPSGKPTLWSSTTDYDCGGAELTSGDDNVWKDVTTGGCIANSECVMKDKISNREWSGVPSPQAGANITNGSPVVSGINASALRVNMRVTAAGIPSGAYIIALNTGSGELTLSQNATATSTVTVRFNDMQWNAAVAYCDGLSWNGQTDWRLPTQKELMEAYNHGLYSAATSNWINTAHMIADEFWSATTASYFGGSAWFVDFDEGRSRENLKTELRLVTCIR